MINACFVDQLVDWQKTLISKTSIKNTLQRLTRTTTISRCSVYNMFNCVVMYCTAGALANYSQSKCIIGCSFKLYWTCFCLIFIRMNGIKYWYIKDGKRQNYEEEIFHRQKRKKMKKKVTFLYSHYCKPKKSWPNLFYYIKWTDSTMVLMIYLIIIMVLNQTWLNSIQGSFFIFLHAKLLYCITVLQHCCQFLETLYQ